MGHFACGWVCLALAATGQTEVLEFSSSRCGPCQEMAPIVQRLEGQGYPIRQIDIDQQPELARRYQVSGVPCFVAVNQGREIDRFYGATSLAELVRFCHKHGASPQAATASAQSNQELPRAERRSISQVSHTKPADEAFTRELLERFHAASVRIRVVAPDGKSSDVGSGTIVDSRQREALVLTCGHIFRGNRGRGSITIDLFGPENLTGLEAEVIGYDLKSDVGLISVKTPRKLVAVPVAPHDYQPEQGQQVVRIGCPHGKDPEIKQTRIVMLDRWQGPSNIEVAGSPVQGCSGGGLFSAQGYVIGVCNAADPEDNQGIFAGVSSIHNALQNAQLAELIPDTNPRTQLAANPRPRSQPRSTSPESPPQAEPWQGVPREAQPQPSGNNPMPGRVATTPQPRRSQQEVRPVNFVRNVPANKPFTPGSTSRLDQRWLESRSIPAPPTRGVSGTNLASHSAFERALESNSTTEVICVIRSRAHPQGQVFVIDRPSQEFMQQLAAESQAVGNLNGIAAQSAQPQRTASRFNSPGPQATTLWTSNGEVRR